MGSPEKSRSSAKREMDERSDGKRDMNQYDEECEGSGKRKLKLSKSKRSYNGEDTDGWDSSTRRRSSGDNRKVSSGSGRGDADEVDYEMKKEPISKQTKKRQDVSALEKLSNWYQDGGLENMPDGGIKSTNKSHAKTDVDEENNMLKKTTSKSPDYDGYHRRGKNKDERTGDGNDPKVSGKDSVNSERRESSRGKGHDIPEDTKSRKRWDEPDIPAKVDDSSYVGKSERKSETVSDCKLESGRERIASSRLDISEVKDRVIDSASEKGKSYSREDRRVDFDRSKSRSRSDTIEQNNKASPLAPEERTGMEKIEKRRDSRTSGHDGVDGQDRLRNPEEDDDMLKDKTSIKPAHPRRSRTPEKSGRHFHELQNSETEYERSGSVKRKDLERDDLRDDKTKDKESSWSDGSKEREETRDSWKRRQQDSGDRNVDVVHDRDRERELPRRGREWMDNERVSRPGNRKDIRGEAVKTSSNFGISNANYDIIEIQPKSVDFGRDDHPSGFSRKSEAVPLHDPNSGKHNDQVCSGDALTLTDARGRSTISDNSSGRYVDEAISAQDQNIRRDDVDGRPGRLRGEQSSFSPQPSGGQSSRGGSQPPHSNQEPNNFSVKVNRPGRGGRVRVPGRDNQPTGMPAPLMGSPFGHLGMPPPGAMQPMNSGMSPSPGPPVLSGVFGSPFSPPVWPGSRGVDMSMLPISPGISSGPPPVQRFPPNIGGPPNPAMYFNQSGQGRGMPSNASGPGFNVPVGRGNFNDRSSGAWVPPKSGGPPSKAPSRGEQNDYSQNFVDTGTRPQNFIRELELTNVEDYPRLRELIQKKDEIVSKAATPPVYYKCDLQEFVLSSEFLGTKFDVILVDPPWEEYIHRAPGVTDHMEYWTFEEIMNLKIEAIADTPSFVFLWVGDGVGLEQGRQCLKKWGFRRCEDICWVKTNKHTTTPSLRHDSHTLFQHTKEHCLMGIKGTVRRSTDGHIIHANIDTDVIIAEEPPYGSTAKPEEMYRIIEHFALGRRRIELFGADHNIRPGWLTLGKELSSSNFNAEAYMKNFTDKDGKVWLGGGGRNPPPDAPHLVQTIPEIEALRPKSPMKNQQQLQQQSNSISLTTPTSGNRRVVGNSSQNPSPFSVNQEASSSNNPWAPPMEGFKGPPDHPLDMYGYNMPPNGEYLDFESRRMMNMM